MPIDPARGPRATMIDHPHHAGSPAIAAGTLLAAALGAAASWLDPAHCGGLAAISPEDLTAWTKAICNNIFTIVNTIVGCYHLLTIGRSTFRGRRGKAKGRRPAADADERAG